MRLALGGLSYNNEKRYFFLSNKIGKLLLRKKYLFFTTILAFATFCYEAATAAFVQKVAKC